MQTIHPRSGLHSHIPGSIGPISIAQSIQSPIPISQQVADTTQTISNVLSRRSRDPTKLDIRDAPDFLNTILNRISSSLGIWASINVNQKGIRMMLSFSKHSERDSTLGELLERHIYDDSSWNNLWENSPYYHIPLRIHWREVMSINIPKRNLHANDVSSIRSNIQALVNQLVDGYIHMYDANSILLDNQELRKLLMTDTMTQIPNRSAMNDLFNHIGTSPLKNPISIIVLDIDNFKRINDTYWHGVWDEVIKKVAQCCHEQNAHTYRLGWEEFVTILDWDGVEEARIFAEDLRRKIASLVFQSGNNMPPFFTSVSIGIFGRSEGEIFWRLEDLHLADQALYVAKNSGRNRVYISDSNMPKNAGYSNTKKDRRKNRGSWIS